MQRRIKFAVSAVLFLLLSSIVMAESGNDNSSEAVSHIVFTESPPEEQQPEAHHLRILASVLGSEDAAKEALLYSYKNVATGFSAKLSPKQVVEISNQPGVISVLRSESYQLHTGTMGLN